MGTITVEEMTQHLLDMSANFWNDLSEEFINKDWFNTSVGYKKYKTWFNAIMAVVYVNVKCDEEGFLMYTPYIGEVRVKGKGDKSRAMLNAELIGHKTDDTLLISMPEDYRTCNDKYEDNIDLNTIED